MYQTYLITGATGFLGSAVVQLLLAHSCRVLALVKNSDPLICTLPNHVAVFYGDLTDKESLRDFFAAGGDDFCVLHCAGLISIASKPDEALYAVNVQGTQNILDLCQEYHAAKLVYVSSVHAIPEKPAPETITEPDRFAPDGILGDYGKSKSMATALVLEAAQSGLNASVVLPSGILGPGDLARGRCSRLHGTRKGRGMLQSFRPLREHSGLACPDGFPAWPESAKALRARRTGGLRCAHF